MTKEQFSQQCRGMCACETHVWEEEQEDPIQSFHLDDLLYLSFHPECCHAAPSAPGPLRGINLARHNLFQGRWPIGVLEGNAPEYNRMPLQWREIYQQQ